MRYHNLNFYYFYWVYFYLVYLLKINPSVFFPSTCAGLFKEKPMFPHNHRVEPWQKLRYSKNSDSSLKWCLESWAWPELTCRAFHQSWPLFRWSLLPLPLPHSSEICFDSLTGKLLPELVPKFSAILTILSRKAGFIQTCLQLLNTIVLYTLTQVKIVYSDSKICLSSATKRQFLL